MSGTNNDREKQVEELESFTQMTQKRLSNIVSDLGWTSESVSAESQNTVTCPFNNGHRIPEMGLENHLEKCQWKAEGYTENDLPLSVPYTSMNSFSAIKFDEQLQDTVLLKAREENPTMHTGAIAPAAGVADRLIPRTSDRIVTSFTSDERKAIYDYVIANTIKLDIGNDIADMNRTTQKDGDQPKTSLLELLAQERNLKRRRAKHRGVHTNKKSQVEILREVINQQMEMYEEYIADSSIKSEPKSPSRSETSSLDFPSSFDRKNYQQTTAWARKSYSRNESKSFDRSADVQTFLSPKRSPGRDYSIDHGKKRKRSESRESGRRKHHSKHKRDRSKDRRRHEEGSGRHRVREDKNWEREEDYQTEDKSDPRKRRHSDDKSYKYIDETPERHEYSSHNHYRDKKKFKETDKSRKGNH